MLIEGQDENPGASSTPDLDANSSAASSTTDTTSSTPSSGETDVKTPSSGEVSEPKKDLLSVVEDVLKSSEKPPVEETPKTQDTKAPETGAASGEVKDQAPDPADVPDAELSKYSANAQKRIKGLIDETKRLRREIETATPALQDYQKMTDYMKEHDLRSEHVSSLLNFGAALRRGDFANAKTIVEPYYFAIKEALGEKLADDVRQKVDDGLIDEDAGRELTRLRSEKSRLETTVKEVQTSKVAEQAQQVTSAIHSSIASWEASVKARDPDYAVKHDLIQDAARAIIQEKGRPSSPQEAVALAQEAYERVNRATAKFRPTPVATRRTPQGGASISTPVAATPKSLMDAVDIGLSQSRAGL